MNDIFKRCSYLIIMLTVLLSTNSLYGQTVKRDTSVFIGGFQTSTFYINEYNHLGVSSTNDSIQNLIIKSSQGTLDNVDSGINNGFLSLTNLAIGKVTIRVYRQTKNGLKLLNWRTFPVIKRPLTKDEKEILKLKVNPEIDIEGYKSGKIPYEAINIATKFNINSPYKISRILILLISNKRSAFSEPFWIELKSQDFNETLLAIVKKLNKEDSGTIFDLEVIDILDNKGQPYKLKHIQFTVE